MSRITPKPIIAEVHRTWRVAPGMVYALAVDIERNVWIVESCPVGTHFWTVQEAKQLPQGNRTRVALREAIREGSMLAKETQTALQYVRRVAKEERATMCENSLSPYALA
ncbi:hypothetical protein LBMAG21_13820 [Armatimonadota bacterium]|nr:hypothetical protein LBMAG21_13820 [Armatimonadota bacterium]